MQQLGFESVQGFFNLNRQLCREEYDRKCTLEGECDLCAGYKKEPPCQKLHGAMSCFARGIPATKDDMVRGLFHAIRKKTLDIGNEKLSFSVEKYRQLRDEGKEIKTFCPPGHGFRGGKMLPVDFDIFWS
jgi:hypothetical protein